MIVVKAPNLMTVEESSKLSIFLAGSIENGAAEDWQTAIIEKIKNKDAVILNPRRESWDSTWTQDCKEMKEQIDWEQDMLFHSDVTIFNFVAGTKSPITLLELGQSLASKWGSNQHIIVCCPKEYWRWANVQYTCDRYAVKVHNSLDDAIEELNDYMEKNL